MPDQRSDTVALLISGSISNQKGGAAMRWRALREALGGPGRCLVVEVGCDHRRQCRDRCFVTGGTPPNPDAGEWHYTKTYCDHHAERIGRMLRASGVPTVVCSGLETHRYASALSRLGGLRVVYDMHNIEFPLFHAISLDSGRTNPYLSRIREGERLAVADADELWTCSTEDMRLLAKTYREVDPASVRVVPNAVTVGAPPRTPSAQPRHVCFPGHLRWHPNIVAVRRLTNDVIPGLRRHACTLPVVVAGLEPGEELTRWCHTAGADLLANPESTTELIRGSIMAVPLTLGGGTRLKVLEAFSLGAPLVSTAKGIEGIQAEPGVHYLQAERSEEFVSAIIRLVADQDLRDGLITMAWRLVRDRYSTAALRDSQLACGHAPRRLDRPPVGQQEQRRSPDPL